MYQHAIDSQNAVAASSQMRSLLEAAEARLLDADIHIAELEIGQKVATPTSITPSAFQISLQEEIKRLRVEVLSVRKEAQERTQLQQSDTRALASLEDERRILKEEIGLLRQQRQRQSAQVSLLKVSEALSMYPCPRMTLTSD